jgi:hypothetical protein
VSILDRLKRGSDPGQTVWKGLRLTLNKGHGMLKETSMPNLPREVKRQPAGHLFLTGLAKQRLREFRLRLGTTTSDVIERLLIASPLPPDFYGLGELPDDPPGGPRQRRRQETPTSEPG